MIVDTARIGEVQVTHFSPGRIRVKLPQLKGNGAQGKQIEQALATVEGVDQVTFSPTTGSLLVLYVPEAGASPAAALAMAKSIGLIPQEMEWEQLRAPYSGSTNDANRDGSSSTVADDIRSFFQSLNTSVDEVSAGKADLKDLLPLMLALLGIGRLLSAERLLFPAWYDYFWYAFSAFMIFDSAKSQATSKSDLPL
ncbi:MAG: hypothetical protein R3C14_26900 [Caldilineaceae bacterium]